MRKSIGATLILGVLAALVAGCGGPSRAESEWASQLMVIVRGSSHLNAIRKETDDALSAPGPYDAEELRRLIDDARTVLTRLRGNIASSDPPTTRSKAVVDQFVRSLDREISGFDLLGRAAEAPNDSGTQYQLITQGMATRNDAQRIALRGFLELLRLLDIGLPDVVDDGFRYMSAATVANDSYFEAQAALARLARLGENPHSTLQDAIRGFTGLASAWKRYSRTIGSVAPPRDGSLAAADRRVKRAAKQANAVIATIPETLRSPVGWSTDTENRLIQAMTEVEKAAFQLRDAWERFVLLARSGELTS